MILLSLLGCLSYTDAQVQRGALNCEWLDACGNLDALGYDGVAACSDAAAAQPYSDDHCPEYAPNAMNACLDAYRDAIRVTDCDADFVEICQVCG